MKIKKYYKYLDLDFDATEQQVLDREKVMIKMIRSNKQKRDEKKIAKVVESANAIINFIHSGKTIKNNSIQFECSPKILFAQTLVFLFVAVMAVYTFLAFVL